MSRLLLRRANNTDMNRILLYISRYNLDGENTLSGQFTVAEVDSKFAGFCRIKPYSKINELSSLGVVEKYRNLGVGAELVKHIIKVFPDDIVWLTTKIPDFFKKFGFIESDDPPVELAEKCYRVCSGIGSSRFMYLDRKQL